MTVNLQKKVPGGTLAGTKIVRCYVFDNVCFAQKKIILD
jgi:hypothetical protein